MCQFYIFVKFKTTDVSMLNVQVPIVDAPDPEVINVGEIILDKSFQFLSFILQPEI